VPKSSPGITLYSYAMSPYAAKVHCFLGDSTPIGLWLDELFPESQRQLYAELVERLGEGPFLGGRNEPSLPDLAAYPQFALYWSLEFRGGADIEESPALMQWLARMRPYVSGEPDLIPRHVRKRELP